MTLTYDNVADIVKIIDASTLDEITLELEGAKISIRRNGAGGISEGRAQPSAVTPAAVTPVIAEKKADVAPSVAPVPVPAQAGQRVLSPMTGTFYTRPAPTEPEFAEVGSRVDAGAPLCVIEVMKLFTTIDAPCSGRVVSVLADNGQLVEHDQPLFIIEPD
jgi:acetyl-CoA carboxylase biotin carboxyl carrier protein